MISDLPALFLNVVVFVHYGVIVKLCLCKDVFKGKVWLKVGKVGRR